MWFIIVLAFVAVTRSENSSLDVIYFEDAVPKFDCGLFLHNFTPTMATEQDDIIAVSEHSSGEFSGFSPESDNPPGKPMKKRTKKLSKTKPKSSKVAKTKGKSSEKTSTNDVRPNTSGNSNFDLNSLGPTDIVKLRELLGINPHSDNRDEDSDVHSLFGTSLENLPNMRVQFNPRDLSGGESPIKTKNISNDMSQALFEDGEILEDNEWDLPRLKIPEKGDAIANSLANMINTACSTQCETETLLSKYKIPSNCDFLSPPLVNNEIWKIMDKRAQSQDRGIVETQNLIAASMIPIIKLAETLKPHITGNAQAKTLLSDALTLIGQVQFNLSVRRRYMIRPVLKKKYHSLCNISMPITSKLFGEDVSKDIKSCDSLVSLGKDQYQRSGYQSKGRGYSRRGAYGNNAYNNGNYNQNSGRYQPYSNRGGQKNWNKNYKIPKKSATATAPAPNEQTQ